MKFDTDHSVVNSNLLSTPLSLKGVKSSNSASTDSTTKSLEIQFLETKKLYVC